jgi:hypothetical protein
MDISKFAKKPTLTKIVMDDAEVIEQYGETIEFHMLDQMSISTYFEFYRLQQDQDSDKLNDLLRKIVLKDDGTPALSEEEIFPVDLTLGLLVKINEFLGKSKAKTSTPTTGEVLK